MSYARRLGDAINPATLLFGRSESQPELFPQGSREDAANGVTLPAGHARHLVDRCTLGLTQHCNHHVLLRGELRVGLRLRDRQHFNRRPQLIDQRVAVANFLSLFDTGQSVPQRQQPLGGAACSSSFDPTAISPSLTVAGALRHTMIPSLPM